MDQRDLEAAKGKAIREYHEFMSKALHPSAEGDMDHARFNELRSNLERLGIDPDRALMAMARHDVEQAKGVAAWKVLILAAIVAAAVYFLFFR